MPNKELTQRLIDRIKEVEKFEDIAELCEDFQSFVDEIQEWGVTHIGQVAVSYTHLTLPTKRIV